MQGAAVHKATPHWIWWTSGGPDPVKGLSNPVYFTDGGKQGCSLSPMLFALYIASLGVVLDNTRWGWGGVVLGKMTLTALFFVGAVQDLPSIA